MLEFVSSPTFTVSPLEFYENFVSEFEQKMNKLSLVELQKLAVEDIQKLEDAETFLKKASSKVLLELKQIFIYEQI